MPDNVPEIHHNWSSAPRCAHLQELHKQCKPTHSPRLGGEEVHMWCSRLFAHLPMLAGFVSLLWKFPAEPVVVRARQRWRLDCKTAVKPVTLRLTPCFNAVLHQCLTSCQRAQGLSPSREPGSDAKQRRTGLPAALCLRRRGTKVEVMPNTPCSQARSF